MARAICKFGVIKYIPNSVKEELVNVGVILHSPKDRQVVIKFLDHEPRIKHFMTDVQIGRFLAFKRLMVKHIKSLRNKLVDPLIDCRLDNPEYLETFQVKLSMPFLMSKPQYIFTECLDEQIESLYFTLVLDPDEVRTKQKPLIKQVEERFVSAGLDSFFERDIKVKNLPFQLNIEFGYKHQNRMDLLQPISFQGSPRENYKEGVFWKDAISRIHEDPEVQSDYFIAIIKKPKNISTSGYSELIRQLQFAERTKIVDYNSTEFERIILNIKNHGSIFKAQ